MYFVINSQRWKLLKVVSEKIDASQFSCFLSNCKPGFQLYILSKNFSLVSSQSYEAVCFQGRLFSSFIPNTSTYGSFLSSSAGMYIILLAHMFIKNRKVEVFQYFLGTFIKMFPVFSVQVINCGINIVLGCDNVCRVSCSEKRQDADFKALVGAFLYFSPG